MRALLLSAYAARSHQHWCEMLLEMFAGWQWQLLELPPRYFSWRVRGNALFWSIEERPALEADYDILIATSMVDLATLRGLVPKLAGVPALLYFHENQFAYPQSSEQRLLEAQMVSLYSALAADRLVFNSSYNRDSFAQGLGALLQRLPDKVPAGVVRTLLDKSEVIPVPVAQQTVSGEGAWPGSTGAGRPVRLLCPGRFEHDKGPERLLLLLRCLEAQALDYELAVVGQQFRDAPAAFAQIRQEFAPRLVHFGHLPEKSAYLDLLASADIVLSTALHEFQGLAVLEAVAAGCVPVVPDRLAYSEIYPSSYRYLSDLEKPAVEAEAGARLIGEIAKKLESGEKQAPLDLTNYLPATLAPVYLKAIQRTAGSM